MPATDLLIALQRPRPDRWALGTKLGACIKRHIGLQKLNILVADPATPD